MSGPTETSWYVAIMRRWSMSFANKPVATQDSCICLRCMHFLSARFDINVSVEHVKGTLNSAADALSRNSLQAFFRVVPSAAQAPTPIPSALWELVVTLQPDWTSPGWRSRLWPLCGEGWPHQLQSPISQPKDHFKNSAANST